MNNRSNLSVFNFEESAPIRVVTREQEPWFVAKDIAEVLAYSDTQAMTRRLDEEELSTCTDNSSGQVRNLTIINESGLYSAILGSTKPEAKRFKKWGTSEVLPAIRKTGRYAVPEAPSAAVKFVPECLYKGIPVLTMRAIAEQSGELPERIGALAAHPESGLIDGEDIFRLTGLTRADGQKLGLPRFSYGRLNLLTVGGARKLMVLRDRIRAAYAETRSSILFPALPAAAPSADLVDLYRRILDKWRSGVIELYQNSETPESRNLRDEQKCELAITDYLNNHYNTDIQDFLNTLSEISGDSLPSRLIGEMEMLNYVRSVLLESLPVQA